MAPDRSVRADRPTLPSPGPAAAESGAVGGMTVAVRWAA
jgi:hypothetical protein